MVAWASWRICHWSAFGATHASRGFGTAPAKCSVTSFRARCCAPWAADEARCAAANSLPGTTCRGSREGGGSCGELPALPARCTLFSKRLRAFFEVLRLNDLLYGVQGVV